MIKKLFLTFIVMFLSFGAAHAIFDKYTLNREQLPETAREMLDEHFPKALVSMIKVDKHLLKKTDYDVKLLNGTKIEFSNSGAWRSVDCGSKEVPEGLVHKTIRSYVSKNYSGAKIVSITKRNAGYDVGLSVGKTLRFNALFMFKGETDTSAGEEKEA